MNEDQMLGLIKDESEHCVAALEVALDVLGDVIQQACSLASDWKTLDSMALSAYANGLRLLAAHGRVEIIDEAGRRVIAKWVHDDA